MTRLVSSCECHMNLRFQKKKYIIIIMRGKSDYLKKRVKNKFSTVKGVYFEHVWCDSVSQSLIIFFGSFNTVFFAFFLLMLLSSR